MDFRALLVLVKIDDLLGNFSNERGHGLEAALAARIAFVDREHDALGLIEDLRRFASFGLQRACDHVVARTDQLSQNGLVVNDFGVAADVGSGGRVVDEFRKIRKAARISIPIPMAPWPSPLAFLVSSRTRFSMWASFSSAESSMVITRSVLGM